MPKSPISFAKVFSPPSATAWAQTYHAGNVYTVVSVTQTEENHSSPEHALPSAHVVGKDIINNLEAEYFAIASKTMETMKEAVVNACKEIPENVSATVIFAVLQHEVLYLFLYGKGTVYIKRNEKFGKLLSNETQPEIKHNVITASGKLQPGDTIILGTEQFMQAIPEQTLRTQITQGLTETADTFSEEIDDERHAGAAAIMFAIEGSTEKTEEPAQKLPIKEIPPVIQTQEIPETKAKEEPTIPDTEPKMNLDEKPHIEIHDQQEPVKEKTKKTFHKVKFRQMFFLLVALTLACILGMTIFVTQHKQQTTQAQTLFASEFPSAKQKYDEGQSLLSLNQSLAQDDFQKAKTILENLQSKLPSNAPETKEAADLLQKVNQQLGPAPVKGDTTLKAADTSASLILSAETADTSDTYFSQNDSTIYGINNTAISAINTGGKQTGIVTNSSDWNNIGGFGAYLGNFYVLDKKANQIFKFVKDKDTYTKSTYFQGSQSSLSKAVSLAIDGSIWVLTDDGSVQKFTKGNPDTFTINSLTKLLNHPTRIVTAITMDNLYILDTGNSRIIAVKKDTGDMIHEYSAVELKHAKDIDADEKNKKIYVLIHGKVFEIDM